MPILLKKKLAHGLEMIVHKPAKKHRAKKHRVHGDGLLGDIWDKIKSAGTRVNEHLKEAKYVGRFIKPVSNALGYNSSILDMAAEAGYGKKRRVHRRRAF